VQSREYHDHNVHPREPRKSLATGSNIFALLTKRRNGICAVALLIGASGAGVGVAAAVGAASASGQAGGWHAATGAQGGAWHSSHAAQGSGGLQVGSHAGVTPHAAVPAPTSSGQNGSGPGRHGHWGGNGNGNGWGNGGGQGSQGAPPAGTTTSSATPTPPPGPQGAGSGGRGIHGHQGIGPHPGGPPPFTTITPHQGVGTPQRGGGQSSGDSQGKQPAVAGRQHNSNSNPATPALPSTALPSGQAGVTTTPLPTQPASSTPPATTPPTPPIPIKPTSHTSPSSDLGSNLPSDIAGLIGASHAVNPAPVTNGLGTALGLTPARTSLLAAATGPLLTAATGAATGTRTGTHAAAHRSAGKTAHGAGSSGPTSTVTRVITGIEHVVPGWVWLILAASLALAAAAATTALVATRRARRQAGQFAAVTAAALTDPLTGVLNRRGFIEALERELARARRYNLRFVLAYVDVRNLKGVNDTEGHLAGDELLKDAAHLLKDSARADDVVGRIGGDEMGLLLVEQGSEGADVVINRITSQIPERQEALGLHAPWDLTVGTSSFPDDGSTATELLATADRRLYEQRGIALH
jgi:diguanylate cyclase (GGDEF)-like protein